MGGGGVPPSRTFSVTGFFEPFPYQPALKWRILFAGEAEYCSIVAVRNIFLQEREKEGEEPLGRKFLSDTFG